MTYYPDAILPYRYRSCICSAKFLHGKFNLKRDVCMPCCRRQLKSETKKYLTNYYLMPEHFDVFLYIILLLNYQQYKFFVIVCSDCSSLTLRPSKIPSFLLDKVGFMTFQTCFNLLIFFPFFYIVMVNSVVLMLGWLQLC